MTKRCHCSLSWRSQLRLKRWVCLERGSLHLVNGECFSEKCSHVLTLVKCLDCGARWRSRAKYCINLRSHTEETRSGMTDDDILQRLVECSLIVDVLAGDKVWSHSRNMGWKELRIIHHQPKNRSGEYRFVEITRGGKKKKISLHRLVWMTVNQKEVPDGYDVDHIEDQGNDGIANLRLLPSYVNRMLPHRPDLASAYEEDLHARQCPDDDLPF